MMLPTLRELDVVIPVAPKDMTKLGRCLDGLFRNCHTPIRQVYVVAPVEPELGPLGPLGPMGPGPITWVPDAAFPFSVSDVRELLEGKGSVHDHASWYFQQLLKLHVFEAIPGIGARVLILDVDFILSRAIHFVDEDGRARLARGYPFSWLRGATREPAAVEHVHAGFASLLVPGWELQHGFSGMQHHMVFDRTIIEELFARAESNSRMPFWQTFVEYVSTDKWNAASEYVLYHHFALQHFPDHVSSYHLATEDLIFDAAEAVPWDLFEQISASTQAYALGLHGFVDLDMRLRTMDYIPEQLREQMLGHERRVFKLSLSQGELVVSAA